MEDRGGRRNEEEEEYGEEDYGEEEVDDDAEPEWAPKDRSAHAQLEDRFFLRDETLKSKYNDVEIDAFMKLLNVKPYA